ncbi:MAG TPA: type II toxin-antitoxin system RelE/ParE family toxin [Candidatus Acidoferrales bacterium]|nr:type II toxin-antitoxin system RelE/ParE family toxin [Candidatus Acidoferrales bacterium]
MPITGPPAPFGVWRDGLQDKRAKAAVSARIARLAEGNFSDSRPIGAGASEARIDFGPGYRVYYGVDGANVILLAGGGKSSQKRDIEIAKARWQDYKRRKNDQTRELQKRSSGRPPK